MYKFTIAMENSNEIDYVNRSARSVDFRVLSREPVLPVQVTEKAFQPFEFGESSPTTRIVSSYQKNQEKGQSLNPSSPDRKSVV